MDYDKVSDNYSKYFKEQVDKFCEALGLEYDDNFIKINYRMLAFNFDVFSKELHSKKMDEEQMRKEEEKIYEKQLKDFSKNILNQVLFSTEKISGDHIILPEENCIYNEKKKNNKDFLKDVLTSFNEFINKISLAYLKEHDLPLNYNNNMGGLTSSDIVTIESHYINPVTRKEEYDFEINHADDKSSKLINDLDNAMDEVLNIKTITDDDMYREIVDFSYDVIKSDKIVVPSEKTSKVDAMAFNIEKVATIYTALREKYHKENGVITNWFTPTGWKESSKINSIRDKMMDTLHMKDKDKFNELMEKISQKGTAHVKKMSEIVDPIRVDFAEKYKDLEKEIIKQFPTEKDKVVEEIPDNLVNEPQNKNVIEEKKEEQIREIEQQEIKEAEDASLAKK